MTGVPHQLRIRSALLAAGYSDGEILRGRRGSELRDLRPGRYYVGPEPEPAERHRLLVHAAVPRLAHDPVVSHISAAALWGMDLWNVDLRPVHVTRAAAMTARARPTLVSHRAALSDLETVERGGLLVTSAARTVVDCGRVLPFESAVVLADSALRLALVGEEELRDALDAQNRMPGARAALRVIRFADARSGSVGESRSRVMIAVHHLPPPELQVPVHDPDGRLIGISDFYWRRQRTIGEFDGRAKYLKFLRPGERPEDAVFREKRREDALRGERHSVVRWVWDDLNAPQRTVGRIARALAIDPA